jgi:hypothetical protein
MPIVQGGIGDIAVIVIADSTDKVCVTGPVQGPLTRSDGKEMFCFGWAINLKEQKGVFEGSVEFEKHPLEGLVRAYRLRERFKKQLEKAGVHVIDAVTTAQFKHTVQGLWG